MTALQPRQLDPRSGADRPDERLPRPRVLIFDGSDACRQLCVGYCDLFDHACEGVASGREALAALKRERFDVVVMNVHPQRGDVLATLRGIRAAAGDAPVIGLTAVGRGHEAQRWLAAGLDAVLAKPVTAARLYAALEAATAPARDSARSWAPAG